MLNSISPINKEKPNKYLLSNVVIPSNNTNIEKTETNKRYDTKASNHSPRSTVHKAPM